MGNVPSEVDLGVDQLSVADGQDLAVTKALPTPVPRLVCHEDSVAVAQQMDEFESENRLVVRPAPFEVGRAVDPIVERAGEMEIVSDDALDGRAVAVGVCLIAPSCHVLGIRRHGSLRRLSAAAWRLRARQTDRGSAAAALEPP